MGKILERKEYINPLVSIVIPVYNVEQFLVQCIESVLNQSYANLQIILVDDGSTDSSSEICDSFKIKDNRILVIHQKNKGLSSARNASYSSIRGEFVLFLDSDDFIEKDTIEKLIYIQRKTKADIVISNYFYSYDDYEKKAEQDEEELTSDVALFKLIEGKIKNFAWGKLIKKEIVLNHLFPEGKLFEDYYWTHLVILDSKIIYLTSSSFVHYRQRSDSISYSFNLKRLELLDAWQSRIDFLNNNFPYLLNVFYQQIIPSFIALIWDTTRKMKKDRIKAFRIMKKFLLKNSLINYAKGYNILILKSLKFNGYISAILILLIRLNKKILDTIERK